ncbi:hypothetical protein B0J12DRAFT_701681 [Macrophomina phaseolina]|uniref:Uncharacterized protein n=1 Tax=Macrophomina phaseolina TaxID=35725 RepID=A0ABQ8G6M8_9PEZI|nr:hypothetical protein B0J12DRAFT_701681 [Macrophomina phaseolina]
MHRSIIVHASKLCSHSLPRNSAVIVHLAPTYHGLAVLKCLPLLGVLVLLVSTLCPFGAIAALLACNHSNIDKVVQFTVQLSHGRATGDTLGRSEYNSEPRLFQICYVCMMEQSLVTLAPAENNETVQLQGYSKESTGLDIYRSTLRGIYMGAERLFSSSIPIYNSGIYAASAAGLMADT